MSRTRILWGIIAIIMAASSVSTITKPTYPFALLFSAALGAAFVGSFHANSIGMTGPGFGLEVMALAGRRALRAYFSGQDIAFGVIAVPLLVAVSFALAAVAGHPVDGFLAAAVDLAGIGASLGLASIFTVVLAYPAEKQPAARRPGRPADIPAGPWAPRSPHCLAWGCWSSPCCSAPR